MLDHLKRLYDQASPISLDESYEKLVTDGHLLVYQGGDTAQYCIFGEKCESHGMHFVLLILDMEVIGNLNVWTYEEWDALKQAHPLLMHQFRKVSLKLVHDTAEQVFRMDVETQQEFLEMLQQAMFPNLAAKPRHRRRPRL